MANQLSGIAIILFIAFGSLTFILLFIFAKRQITRFALKSRRGPHVAVGVDAPKSLRQEIERRLDVIDKMRCEPWLLQKSAKDQFEDENLVTHLSPPHLYRMKVVDDVKMLCNAINAKFLTSQHVGEDTHQYFIRLHKEGIMPNTDVQTLHKFLVLYETARHQPDDFVYEEYCQFFDLLQYLRNDILHCDEVKKSKGSLHKSKRKVGDDHLQTDESTKPLLTGTVSYSAAKMTHETSV